MALETQAYSYVFCCLLHFVFFKKGFHYVAKAGLKLRILLPHSPFSGLIDMGTHSSCAPPPSPHTAASLLRWRAECSEVTD